MKNILSCRHELFTGKEIKEWIVYHTEHNTSKSRLAKYMLKYMNIENDTLYEVLPGKERCGLVIRGS